MGTICGKYEMCNLWFDDGKIIKTKHIALFSKDGMS